MYFVLLCITKELRRRNKNTEKWFKYDSQIYEITKHEVHEKIIKALKVDCSTFQNLFIWHR